ncbi:MAG: hypothetical protein M1818_002921 [Claussenomyces sp. TS43310]|nr:MAG: hypothetical protein M1818_002921 [Claussenomyces sp. TS43310]
MISSSPGKRKYQEMTEDRSRASPFLPIFEVFREELDQHHDRRERIIKASRDITALSKKAVRDLTRAIPTKIATEVQERYSSIQHLLVTISPDLQGINAWRYQRQISPGLQEFVEAVSFEHYLRTQYLISCWEASQLLPKGIALTGDDYVLGIFDLVGEIMRFSITGMATTGSLPRSNYGTDNEERSVLTDLRSLRSKFEALDIVSHYGGGLGKDIEKKMEVMRTCVEKVETAMYGMIVRGRERPKGWSPDVADERPPPEIIY